VAGAPGPGPGNDPPPAPSAPDRPPPPEALGGQLQSLRALWPSVIGLVRTENALLGALIDEAEPVAVAGQELTVAFAASAPFLKKKAEDPANRAAVTAALREVSGARWNLSYELRGQLDTRGPDAQPAGSEEEWVRRLMAEFDAEEMPGERAAERDQAHTGAGSGSESAAGERS
jgi:hypothetical protein